MSCPPGVMGTKTKQKIAVKWVFWTSLWNEWIPKTPSNINPIINILGKQTDVRIMSDNDRRHAASAFGDWRISHCPINKISDYWVLGLLPVIWFCVSYKYSHWLRLWGHVCPVKSVTYWFAWGSTNITVYIYLFIVLAVLVLHTLLSNISCNLHCMPC